MTKKQSNEADTDAAAAKAAHTAQASGEEIRKDMVGHNKTPGLNPVLQAIFKDTHIAISNRQQISKTIRDLRMRAKKEFNINSSVFNDELRLQQLDDDVRTAREAGLRDLQAMLGTGYQLAFDLAAQQAADAGDPNQDPVAAGKREKAKLKTV